MIQAHAYVTLNPSFIEPEFLMQYSQASGFVDLYAEEQMRVRLGQDDLLVYMKQMNVRSKMAASQAGSQELPSVDIQATMIQAPTYLLQVGNQYNHHDVAAGARWGFAVPEAYRLGGRQANFQLARDAGLYGMNPQNGEGIVNAPNAIALNLPPDTFGNSTVTTYDNGQMAFFLSSQVLNIKSGTNQLGLGRKFTFLGPQRTLGLFEYNVVQLVQYQRPGAGTQSTAGTTKEILMANGDSLTWAYDDTLIGQGANGTDLVIIAMPELDKPAGKSPVNTNIFASMLPANKVCLTQYCDMAAPREIISPLARGATDMLQEWRISSGWAPRYQALRLISMQYQ
jgi:hypothetical protein